MTTQNTNTEENKTTCNCMKVTSVNVFPFKEGPTMGSMRGLASVTLCEQIAIRGLRIMDGKNGMFVAYPIDTFYKGEDYKNIVFPLTKELKDHIENAVLEKYQAAMG